MLINCNLEMALNGPFGGIAPLVSSNAVSGWGRKNPATWSECKLCQELQGKGAVHETRFGNELQSIETILFPGRLHRDNDIRSVCTAGCAATRGTDTSCANPFHISRNASSQGTASMAGCVRQR